MVLTTTTTTTRTTAPSRPCPPSSSAVPFTTPAHPPLSTSPPHAPHSPQPPSSTGPLSEDWRLQDDCALEKGKEAEDDEQPGLPLHLKALPWPSEKKESDDPHLCPPHSAHHRLQPSPTPPRAASPAPPPLPPRPPKPVVRLAVGAGGSPRPQPSPPPSPAAPPSPSPPTTARLPASPSHPALSSFTAAHELHIFPPLPSIPPLLSPAASAVPLLHRQGSSMPPLIVETVHPAIDLSSAANPRPYLRLLLPPSSPSDPLHALCCRKKSHQPVWRFSVDPDRLTRAKNPHYAGSLTLIPPDPAHLSSPLLTFDLCDADDRPAARVVVERGRKSGGGGCRVAVEMVAGYGNEVEAGRAGRVLVGGELDDAGLLVLRVEASDRAVLVGEELVEGRRRGGWRKMVTMDYPLTLFMGFAVLCAVEFSSDVGELRRGHSRSTTREMG